MSLEYLSGFRNHHETEAEKNALPIGRNSPQKPTHGLYAEQVNFTAFTSPRNQNLKSWFYRTLPSVVHSPYEAIQIEGWKTPPFQNITPPDQYRWDPIQTPKGDTTFLKGVFTVCGHGSTETASGASIHIYQFNQSMDQEFFYNADAEMMFIPYEGSLLVSTEYGDLQVRPKEIFVIPRGCKFQLKKLQEEQGWCKGYFLENFGIPFQLPELGPIGANGLANQRDFLAPVAKYSTDTNEAKVYCKFEGNFFFFLQQQNPCNVVAWHGNYYPYKYDLQRFNTIGTISFDHPDPSIFTVLTSPSGQPGVANVDFVIFPERWMVGENTFRPPYYHRNLMSEYMGLIEGVYDAKEEGFVKGGGSLHNRMSAHGPDANTFEKASHSKLTPTKQENTLAFMWESLHVWKVTDQALKSESIQKDYLECWSGLKQNFSK